MPNMVGLRKAVKQEKRGSAAGLYAVDANIRADGSFEFFETFEHFDSLRV